MAHKCLFMLPNINGIRIRGAGQGLPIFLGGPPNCIGYWTITLN